MKKPAYVTFATRALERSFDRLHIGDGSERDLHQAIEHAIIDIKRDPTSSIHLPRRIWPQEYLKSHSVDNLWKKNLPKGWRLIYTIKTDEVMILAIILEWFDHEGYENRFKY